MSLPWLSDDAEPNADKWARPDETRERVIELYQSTWELADATVQAPARVKVTCVTPLGEEVASIS